MGGEGPAQATQLRRARTDRGRTQVDHVHRAGIAEGAV
jgi:hypothetical protein